MNLDSYVMLKMQRIKHYIEYTESNLSMINKVSKTKEDIQSKSTMEFIDRHSKLHSKLKDKKNIKSLQ